MSDDELDAIRDRLAAHPDDPDGYEGHGCEPGPAGTLRSTRERDVMADLRALLAALDASQREVERLRAATAGHADGTVQRADVVYTRGYRAGRDEARAEVERLRDALDASDGILRGMREHGLRLARARLLAEIEEREPATDADVRVALLLDAVADARRAAFEEAIAECQRVLDASPGDDAGIVVAVKRLRALLTAPAPEAT